jgi:glycosyltransferase involved in cell wall biosynthesis
MLADYFAEYKTRNPSDLALAFVGPVSAKSPEHPDIVVTGTVSEADKWDILAGAQVMVTPSAYESFSLVVLEAWTLGVPVLVNGACAATMEHCQRSGGGLWFDSYRSFEATVGRLTGDGGLRTALGEAGRRYTEHHYLWPSIIDRYTTFLEGVVARGRRRALRPARLQLQSGGTAYVREVVAGGG